MRNLAKFQILLIPVLIWAASGCTLQQSLPDSPVPSVTIMPPSAVPDWTDVGYLFQGVCFESALDAAGQQFTLRSTEDLITFYDLADNSHLCRRAVTRMPFDFSGGNIVTGIWSVGRGCTADHEVVAFNRDDQAQTITIAIRLITAGDCNYELVRPFWISLANAADYTVNIQVE